MSVSIHSLGLDRLSLAERILLVEELWDSIAATPEAVSLTDSQQRDLQRRLDAYRDNPQAGSPWEEVKTRLQGHRS
jgi:putative addiction module component (TIGR02574 family)